MHTKDIVHIRRSTQWSAQGVGDIWAYRGLLLSLGIRDVKLRYKQTLLGVLWVVLQPLLSTGIMTAVFGYIAAVPSPKGVPYFAFVYLGQMAWTLFSLTVARTSGSMVGSIAIVMKIYFPRPILPLATLLAVFLDFAISFAIAVPLVVLYGTGELHLSIVAIASVLLTLCGAGIGFVLAALSVRFRDVMFVLPLLLQLGVYLSPVAYSLEIARTNLDRYSPSYFDVYMLNPLTALVEAFRWGLLGQGLFLPGYFAYGAALSILMFIAGFSIFRAAEGKFADVI